VQKGTSALPPIATAKADIESRADHRRAAGQSCVGGQGARAFWLIASGLALPVSRITVNLAPADLPKEESHYDLPIAFGLMAAIGPSCGMAPRPSSPRTVKLLSDLFALAASFRINVRSRRWWSARAIRRDLTGAQRCPLPRRAAGILGPGPRFIAAAARNRRNGSLACLSRPLHAAPSGVTYHTTATSFTSP